MPFGQERAGQPQSLPTDRNFTGQPLDSSTNLLYYGARYYDPALGRFLQADTIVPQPGNPQSLNRYSYVMNNPVKYTDPTGHADACFCDGSPSPAPIYFSGLYRSDEQHQAYLDWADQHPDYNPSTDPILNGGVRAGWMSPDLYRRDIEYEYNLTLPSAGLGLSYPEGTLQVGLGASAFAAGGVRGSGSLALDTHGNIGALYGGGGGGYIGLGISSGLFIGVTNAHFVSDLTGESTQVGGSVAGGFGAGAEVITSFANGQLKYAGLTVSGGFEAVAPLPFPFEAHLTHENSQFAGNIFNIHNFLFGRHN
ncbi:MAG: hypothetical protein EXR62_10090 [Chloroflexi bacterium]|nr:hypothetical protein [Chloroflexota bacterium]